MEAPRFWRDMPANMNFSGKEKGVLGKETSFFKYPGGEISLMGTYEQIYKRFGEKGFKAEITDQVLFNLFGAVASKTAISFEKFANSQSEFVGREVRKEDRSEVKFRVDRLPRKISRKTLFSASANN